MLMFSVGIEIPPGHRKSQRQLNRSVQQAAFLAAGISALPHCNNLGKQKGKKIKAITDITSSTLRPLEAAETGRNIHMRLYSWCLFQLLHLPAHQPMRYTERSSWSILLAASPADTSLTCPTAVPIVWSVVIKWEQTLPGLPREVLSLCASYLSVQGSHKPLKNQCSNSCMQVHIWPYPALTQLWCLQPWVLHSCLEPVHPVGLFAQQLSSGRALHRNLPVNRVGWLFSSPVLKRSLHPRGPWNSSQEVFVGLGLSCSPGTMNFVTSPYFHMWIIMDNIILMWLLRHMVTHLAFG